MTVRGIYSYPIYRRCDADKSIHTDKSEKLKVDNKRIVPYNPWLLRKYNCHINVEICSSLKNVKYIYKYVYKGLHRISTQVRLGPNYDEIQQFVDAR